MILLKMILMLFGNDACKIKHGRSDGCPAVDSTVPAYSSLVILIHWLTHSFLFTPLNT